MRIIGALTASLPGNTHKARITGALRTHIVLQHILGLVFSFPQQFHQFPAVCGDQFLFQLAALDLDGHIIVVGADQPVTPARSG